MRLPAFAAPYGSLLLFAVVGGVGFIVDGGLLTLLSQYFQLDVYFSRLISFSAATLTTWLLNRALVFKSKRGASTRKSAEYGRYLCVQVVGAAANLGVFTLVIAAYFPLKSVPVIPLAIGAVFGLLVNYTGSRYWVFAKGRNEEINV